MEGRHEVGGGSGGSLAMGGLCSAPGPELRFNVANSRGGLELAFWPCTRAFPFCACVLSCL